MKGYRISSFCVRNGPVMCLLFGGLTLLKKFICINQVISDVMVTCWARKLGELLVIRVEILNIYS
jgi:hypothetical protein